MTRSPPEGLLGPEFNNFLFAPIEDRGDGELLSVLSALARLGVDPWREAAELAEMPPDAAKRRMSALIAALPDVPAARPAADAIADRLVRLLPRLHSLPHGSRQDFLGADPALKPRNIVDLALISLLIVVGISIAQCTMTSLRPNAGVDTANTWAAGPRMPAPDGGHQLLAPPK